MTITEVPSGLLNTDPEEDGDDTEETDVSEGSTSPEGSGLTEEPTKPAPKERKTGFPAHWRASTPEEQEAAFLEYVDRSAPYMDKIRTAGDEPWHGGDIEKRRDLFMRRYSRPAAPVGMPRPESVAALNHNGWK